MEGSKTIAIFSEENPSGESQGKFAMVESLIGLEIVTIRAACQAFGISQSAFYAHRHKPQRPRCQQDAQIV